MQKMERTMMAVRVSQNQEGMILKEQFLPHRYLNSDVWDVSSSDNASFWALCSSSSCLIA